MMMMIRIALEDSSMSARADSASFERVLLAFVHMLEMHVATVLTASLITPRLTGRGNFVDWKTIKFHHLFKRRCDTGSVRLCVPTFSEVCQYNKNSNLGFKF